MDFQLLYNEYLNIKFNRGLPSLRTDSFEYCLCEDEGAELFFAQRDNVTFTEWVGELQPRDPNYTPNPDWRPILSDHFEQLDVYEELILYYLLFTVNATTSIIPIHPYNAMNDFMKNYCFLQLTRVMGISRLDDEQRAQLRDFFLFFYLYTHPVNGETLYAFSFSGPELVHTKTGIRVENYFAVYHDYYKENYDMYSDKLPISPREIDACKNLSIELLRLIEGKSARLELPPEEGLEAALQWINDVDAMISIYTEDKAKLFEVMRELHTNAGACSTPYRNHCYRLLLQNYVCYILYFNFDEIHELVNYFKETPALCSEILSKLFTDAIFIQKIMRDNRVDIRQYADVTEFFDERAREMYL